MAASAAWAAVAISAAAAANSAEQQRIASNEQKKSQREQQAINASKAAQERRQQIREERIRRAQIIQASENTGTTASSGQIGAVGSAATQFSGNVGFNLGMQRSADLISNFQQNAQDALDNATMVNQYASIASSALGAYGNMAAPKPTTQPATQPANISRGGGFSPSN